MDSSCLYPTLGKLYFYFCFHLCFSAKIAFMRKPRTTVRLFSLVPFLQELYLCTALCLMCEEGCFMYFIKFSVCVWRANPGLVTISWLEVKASSPWFLNPLLFSWYLSWQYHCFSYISLHIFPHQHNPKPCYCSPKEDPSVWGTCWLISEYSLSRIRKQTKIRLHVGVGGRGSQLSAKCHRTRHAVSVILSTSGLLVTSFYKFRTWDNLFSPSWLQFCYLVSMK